MRLSGNLFCVLVPLSTTLVIVSALVLASCGAGRNDWQEVRLDLPVAPDSVVYVRKPMPNVWVGTEQYRRLRVRDSTLELAAQMGGRTPVNVYLRQDSARTVLQFEESEGTISVDLVSLDSWGSYGRSDSLGMFLGTFVSPEIRDLRFVPATEADPADFGP